MYTDGSTNPKLKHANSGCSVVITDPGHQVLWQGGMPVRSDGNNFIPELAAATCAIKALPKDVHMTLRIDSMATIGAISKGVVSERRRVRAAGRAWLNFSRVSSWKSARTSVSSMSLLIKETRPRSKKEMDVRTNLRIVSECSAKGSLLLSTLWMVRSSSS